MERRDFLRSAATGITATALATPVFAQTTPDIQWRLISNYPPAAGAAPLGADIFARQLAELTDGRFHIDIAARDDGAPAVAPIAAVASGAAPMAYGAASDSHAADPAFTVASGVPFGLTPRQQNAWLLQGGGNEAFNEVCRRHGVRALPLGNTGGPMGGWYRREIGSLADISGLRLSVGGLAGAILEKLGGIALNIAPADIGATLEKAAIDGVELEGPYDEAALDLAKAAPYYYAPGFWGGSRSLHLFVNLAMWEALPNSYRSAIASAASYANSRLQARTDAATAAMLKSVGARGGRLRAFPRDVTRAAQNAAAQLYAEIGARDAGFKAMIGSMTAFRNEELLWLQLAEYSNPGAGARVAL